MNTEILIIAEGKKENIKSIEQYLIENGYDTTVIFNGLDGFNHVRSEKPDLVLIEAVLSEYNGYHICSLLKHDIKYEDIIIVILAEGAGSEEWKLATSCQADGILSTPVDFSELMGIVKSVQMRSE